MIEFVLETTGKLLYYSAPPGPAAKLAIPTEKLASYNMLKDRAFRRRGVRRIFEEAFAGTPGVLVNIRLPKIVENVAGAEKPVWKAILTPFAIREDHFSAVGLRFTLMNEVRDATELLQAVKKADTGDAILLKDGVIHYLSPGLIETFDLSMERLARHQYSFLDLLASHEHRRVRTMLVRAEKAPERRFNIRTEGRRRRGGSIFFALHGEYQRSTQGLWLQGTIEVLALEGRDPEAGARGLARPHEDLLSAHLSRFQSTLEGEFLAGNQSFLRLLKFASMQEFLSADRSALYYDNFEKERFLVSIFERGRVEDMVLTLQTRDGVPVITRLSAVMIRNDAGQPLFIDGLLQDISEHMRIEAEYNRLANFPQRNPNPVLEMSIEGEILFYNPATEKLLQEVGLQESELYRLLPPNLASYARMLSLSNQTSASIEHKAFNRIFVWMLHFIQHEFVFHVYGFDITERKQLESQLLQSQKMQSLGTLTGGIAHDFNNLLMGIMGYANLLLSELPEDSPIYKDISNIDRVSQRAANLARQLLAFSRKSMGEPQLISANELIEETLALFSKAVREIHVHRELDAGIPGVWMDAAQFQQILMNLFMNAKDAMPEGGELTVTTREVHLGEQEVQGMDGVKPGSFVRIQVSDTGVGIPRAHLDHVFEPFFTTKDPGRGTGLGLSIVYGIVKNSGGHIAVESKEGLGTTLKLYLPAAEGPDDEHETAMERLPSGHETVLLVDDEPSVVDVTQRLLAKYGYTVIVAESGAQAIEIFKHKKDQIDLILADFQMPEIDGCKMLDKLKKMNSEVKSILASGFFGDEKVPQLASLGINRFVQKPFQLPQLLRTIRDVLDDR